MGDLLIPALIVFCAGFVQGLTGFGAGLVSIPLFALLMDIKVAVPIIILNGMVLLSIMLIKVWRDIDKSKIAPLITGSLPGVFVGVYMLDSLNENGIRLLLAVVLIAYSLYALFVKELRMKVNEKFGYLVGFISGVVGGITSATGPPVVIYAAMQGWNGDKFRATLTGFFFVTCLFMVTAYVANGLVTEVTLKYFMVCAPFIAMGTLAGARFYKSLNQETFRKVVYVLLLIMGGLMIPV